MLDLAWIRDHAEEVRQGAKRKHLPCPVDELLLVDGERRALVRQAEEARAEQNALGQQLKSLGGEAKVGALERLKHLKTKVAEHGVLLAPLEARLEALQLQIPNPPDAEVPEGQDERGNVEVRRSAEPATPSFAVKDHIELLTRLDMLDIERAGRLAGSRSYVLKGQAVLLELAVLRLGLDLIVARGFTPLSVPVVVKEWALRGTAYFPGAEEQTYRIANPTAEDESSWLVGTSEVSVTALHAGEILDRARLPIRYAGISPCFRREAGTYGKDTRGPSCPQPICCIRPFFLVAWSVLSCLAPVPASPPAAGPGSDMQKAFSSDYPLCVAWVAVVRAPWRAGSEPD